MSAIYTNTAGDKILTNLVKGNAMRFLNTAESKIGGNHNPALVLSNKITMEAWVNIFQAASSSTQRRDIIQIGSQFLFAQHETGKLGFYIYGVTGDYILSNSVIPTKKDTHTAVTWNGVTGNVNFLINGEIDRTVTSIFGATNGTDNAIFFGGLSSNGSRRMNGLLDEARIWDIDRSQADIQARMNERITTATQNRTNLVGCYGFDEASGVALDSSPIGNHTLESNMGSKQWRVGATAPLAVKGTKIIRK